MNKHRIINTNFWQDAFIEELTPPEKLLFIYLLTNSLTTLIGVYEITVKRIAYDTQLERDFIMATLNKFSESKKIHFTDNFIVIKSWLKNQKLNENMKISANKEINKLPNRLKILLLNPFEPLPNPSEPLSHIIEYNEMKCNLNEMEFNGLLEDKSQKKIKEKGIKKDAKRHKNKACDVSDTEKTPPSSAAPPSLPKRRKTFQKPTIEQIKAYCAERSSPVDPQKFFDYYESNGWRVGKNPMVCWQATVRTWERNQINQQSNTQNNETNNRNRRNNPESIAEGDKDYSWGDWQPNK